MRQKTQPTTAMILAAGEPIHAYELTGDERLWWIDTPADLQQTRADWERSQA